ncbi:MAG: hypothetical protein LBS48_00015 [Treponema sp.]|jgi:hypothetical protein|nr:hypothetical protein [Treponema sp.]
MKKVFSRTALAVSAAAVVLAFAGCSLDDSAGPQVKVTVTGLSLDNMKYFSLSVFKEAADITYNSSSQTKLKGAVAEGVGMGSSNSVTLSLPEIKNGDYVLVLGVSSDMKGGKMYITGTDIHAGKVRLNFSSGAASVSFNEFLKNSGNGWEADTLAEQFGGSSGK